MIFAHGYPHHWHPRSVAWLPEGLLRRTPYNETTQSWPITLDAFGVRYLGYDMPKDLPFVLDLEPSEYELTHKHARPLKNEEELFGDFCDFGLEDELLIPYRPQIIDKLAPIDPEHDVFTKGKP
jgi:hypothetical protein